MKWDQCLCQKHMFKHSMLQSIMFIFAFLVKYALLSWNLGISFHTCLRLFSGPIYLLEYTFGNFPCQLELTNLLTPALCSSSKYFVSFVRTFPSKRLIDLLAPMVLGFWRHNFCKLNSFHCTILFSCFPPFFHIHDINGKTYWLCCSPNSNLQRQGPVSSQ